jgi:magnesium chelatase subunit D
MKRTRYNPPVFPFAALVGQDLLKLGLVLNAINPHIGGIIIRGDKGTAKSTAARALAWLLPDIETVSNCPYHCDPSDSMLMCSECRRRFDAAETLPVEKEPVRVVELPLNTTEDRLVGSIDFGYALHTGAKRFQPGLLAEANQGVIYIDEVNLLEDHLVDILLDAAVSGINIVERENISFIHPSRFILIASMNPEEGDIRPQLLDRFGLSVRITGLPELMERAEIMRRREYFDTDPDGFLRRWQEEQDSLQAKIVAARRMLAEGTITEEQISRISEICMAHHVAGHRADIIIEKTARTLAAWQGRYDVGQRDIYQAAELALEHRARGSEKVKGGKQNARSAHKHEEGINKEPQAEEYQEDQVDEGERGSSSGDQPSDSMGSGDAEQEAIPQPGTMIERAAAESGEVLEKIFDTGEIIPINTHDIRFARDNLRRRKGGRRARTTTSNKTGRYVRATSERFNDDLAFDATLRAAASHQLARSHHNLAVTITESDIREKVRQKKSSSLLLFVVDASGSMGKKLMTETKGTIMALLLEAYQKRDKVSMVAFKARDAEVLLPPTNSIEVAKKLLEELPTGGTTPMALGLLTAYRLIRAQLRQDPELLPLMVIITDGLANVGLHKEKSYEGTQFGEIYREIYDICNLIRADDRVRSLVIDTEEKGMSSFDRSKKLAEALTARYYVLEVIASQGILKTVKSEI